MQYIAAVEPRQSQGVVGRSAALTKGICAVLIGVQAIVGCG